MSDSAAQEARHNPLEARQVDLLGDVFVWAYERSCKRYPAITQMLATALDQLHEGSIARYRLRRSEYLAWQQALAQP